MTPEQLKASILQRAMEGKLVPQDPNDEPASELLKRVKIQKEKLISEGKIKRDKNETEIFRGADGLHYEKFSDGTVTSYSKTIPKGWELTHFTEICSLQQGSIKRGPFGSSITKSMFVKKSENTYKVYEQGNAIRKTVSYGDYWISSSDFNRLSGFSVKPGDVIISCSGTIGEIFIIPEGSPPGIINQALLKITVNETIMDIDYFKLLFQSLVAILKENSIGSAIKNIASVTYLKYQIPILLPPLPEQRRIVKKIDSLFKKAELFNFYSNRLNMINDEFPKKLQNSILQYAMQGKLTSQDENGESVETLLKKIRDEKEKLFAAGKLKKKDLEENIIYKGDDNSYYKKKEVLSSLPPIPQTWQYCYFGDVINYKIGKTPPRANSNFWTGNIPWVSISDMKNQNTIKKTKETISDRGLELFSNGIVQSGTLLMSFKLTIGRVAILGLEAVHNEAIISVVPFYDIDNIFRDYLYTILPTIVSKGKSRSAIKGETLNSKSIHELIIPLPNLSDQQKIIKKINQINEKINLITNLIK